MNTLEQSISTAPYVDGNEELDQSMALSARRQAFRKLHQAGCFVMPNPWDVGSARYLQHLGFTALATTSAGFAFSQGLPDTDVALTRSRNLTHIRGIAAAVDLPVSADFASAYGSDAEGVADSVTQCVATGVAGLSIEDATGNPTAPLFELSVAVERLKAARQATDDSGCDVLVTARAECYHVGHPDPLNESVRRLQAYSEAGADVLFAPGVKTPEGIKVLVEAIQPKPFNLLVVSDIGLRVDDIAALGVRRISVGGAFALAAWNGFMRAAEILKSEGSFTGLANVASYTDINRFLAEDVREREYRTRAQGAGV